MGTWQAFFLAYIIYDASDMPEKSQKFLILWCISLVIEAAAVFYSP